MQTGRNELCPCGSGKKSPGRVHPGRTVKTSRVPRLPETKAWSRRLSLVLGAASLSWGCAACASDPQVRDAFARQFACPPARVTVVEQHGRAYSPGPPPDAIARDPDRRAYWESMTGQLTAKMGKRTYYLTRGCGHEALYACVGKEVPGNNYEFDCYATQPGQLDPDLEAPPSMP
jgi:hypothetical protein